MKKFTRLIQIVDLPSLRFAEGEEAISISDKPRRLPRRPRLGGVSSQRRLTVFVISPTFVLSALLLFTGCGKKTLYNMPAIEERGFYETAWIDPAVVVEDEWYTLLRSERVDSFYVEIKPGENLPLVPSVEFHISRPECLTHVNLMNGRREIVRPLLIKNLRQGFYKLTFNVGRLKNEELPPGDYFLKAEYCGFTVITDLGQL